MALEYAARHTELMRRMTEQMQDFMAAVLARDTPGMDEAGKRCHETLDDILAIERSVLEPWLQAAGR